MGKLTGIAWCDHTFNHVWGCTRVSPGCALCYAETIDRRWGGGHWGPGKPRRVLGAKTWNEPRKWGRAASKAGVQRRVFCASMADVFDEEGPASERERLWRLIRETANLDWLILTKRPQNILEMLPSDWGEAYPNVWLGVTAEDRARWDERVPILRRIPARVRFVLAEPLLGDLALSRADLAGIDWLIVGGESGGSRARPMNLAWARALIAECRAAGIVVFVKQLGQRPLVDGQPGVTYRGKGADPAEWPEDLRVQTFPMEVPRPVTPVVMEKRMKSKSKSATLTTTVSASAIDESSNAKTDGSKVSKPRGRLIILTTLFERTDGDEVAVFLRRSRIVYLAVKAGNSKAFVGRTLGINREDARLYERAGRVWTRAELRAMREERRPNGKLCWVTAEPSPHLDETKHFTERGLLTNQVVELLNEW